MHVEAAKLQNPSSHKYFGNKGIHIPPSLIIEMA